MKPLNFGTLNAKGIKSITHNDGSLSLDLDRIIQDINKNNIDVLAIQETHLGEKVHQQKENGYLGFFTNDEGNRYHGAGILIKKELNPTFSRISARVCTARFKLNNNRNILFISGYAPHEKLSNDHPDQREAFYEDLQKAQMKKCANTIVIIGLDANAKTQYIPEENANVIGQYTKGNTTNNNGTKLLEFAAQNELYLTNTHFRHKMSRRSTWTAIYRPIKMPNGQIRKNPVRNQIDYILISKKYLKFVSNSRSYNNIHTESDHNLVIMNLNLELSKLNAQKKDPTPRINLENFKNKENIKNYQQKIYDKEGNPEKKQPKDNNELWSNIVETCLEAGKEALGIKEKVKTKKQNEGIKNMSEIKERLRQKIATCNSAETRDKLNREMKNTKKKINEKLKQN